MSIHLPETNQALKNSTGRTPFRLGLGALNKAANAGMTLGFWVQTPVQFDNDSGGYQIIATRNGGAGGGSDAYIAFAAKSNATRLMVNYSAGGASIIPAASATLTSPGLNKTFLLMLIFNAANTHVVLCEPGGTPVRATIATTAGYTTALTQVLSTFGPGATTYFGGFAAGGTDIEEFFALQGLFPESGGVPSASLIQALANGTQDLNTLEALMTNGAGGNNGTGTGARACRYRMLNRTDLTDSWGLLGALTKTGENATGGTMLLSRGRLRAPATIRANRVSHLAGQLEFATTGVLSSATTALDIEGGTISDTTVRSIQARLIKEDETDHLAWWTVASSASAMTTWPATVKADIPAATGFLELEFRALNGSGVLVGQPVRSNGIRATCIVCMGDSHGQSQFTSNWETHTNGPSGLGTGPIALPVGSRMIEQRQQDTSRNERLLGSDDDSQRGPSRGIRQITVESNALFPGIPVFVATTAEQGTSPLDHTSTGIHGARTALLRELRGSSMAKYFIFMFGHSSLGSITADEAEKALDDTIALAEGNLGPAAKWLIAPVSGMGNGQPGNDPADSQDGFLNFAADPLNAPKAFLCGDWSWIQPDGAAGVEPATGSGGHGERCDTGMGQFGSMMFSAFAAAANAIPDRPRKLTAARAIGTSVELTYGLVDVAAVVTPGDTTAPVVAVGTISKTTTTASIPWSTTEGAGEGRCLIDTNATALPDAVRASGDPSPRAVTASGPQTPFAKAGLAPGTSYVAHVVQVDAASPANVSAVVNVPFTTEAATAFFTMGATGPYYRDPSNALPANTSVIEIKGRMRMPSTVPTWTGGRVLAAQESLGNDWSIARSTTNFTIYMSGLEDSGGTTLTRPDNPSVSSPLDTWVDFSLVTDLPARLVTMTVNGAVTTFAISSTPATNFFQIGRELSFLGSTAGSNLMPEGVQVEYIEAYLTTNGVRALKTDGRVSGPTSAANSHPWVLNPVAT